MLKQLMFVAETVTGENMFSMLVENVCDALFGSEDTCDVLSLPVDSSRVTSCTWLWW